MPTGSSQGSKDINKPKGKILTVGSFKDSTDYKFYTYQEYIHLILNNNGLQTSTKDR